MVEFHNMTRNVSNVTVYNMATGDNNTTLGVIYLVISVLVMLSNSVVITVIVTTQELHLPTLWNLAFMAACDFSFGLYILICSVPSAFLNRFAYSYEDIGWAASFGSFLNGQNTLNVVLAVLDRYISICWPMKYAQIITINRFILVVFVSVIVNTVRTICIIFPDMDFYYSTAIALCVSDFNTALGTFTSVTITTFSFGTIFFCLIRIIMDISRSRRRVHPNSTGPSRHVLRFSFTIALATTVFCLSYIPSIVVILWNFISGKENVPKGFSKFSAVALVSNSLWNVIIYATTYRPFKDALQKMACKALYRRRKQNEALMVFTIYNEAIF